jgi:5-hydroxyisourate hydrolase-like protein (transthyretin family)
MAILSSHLLNSVNGEHAGKVKIKIFIIDQNGNKDIFLETSTDIGGRMSEEFSLSRFLKRYLYYHFDQL